MLPVPTSMTDGWNAQFKGGSARPVHRVTVQKMNVILINYDLSVLNSTNLHGSGQFTSMPFGQASKPIELTNLKNVSWNRNLGQFAAGGTVGMTNTKSLGVGVLSDEGEFEKPGTWTYARGLSAEAQSRWGYTPNEQNGLLVPDRIIRIYAGYGVDTSVAPEADPHLVCVFTGLIDTVVLNTDKSLQISFRDLARALLDTVAWPEVVPLAQYPLTFSTFPGLDANGLKAQVDGEPIVTDTTTGSWKRPTYDTDSNKPYVGRGFTDGSRAYVESSGGFNGHLGKHAFDSHLKSYWLSVGNRQTWPSAYEYVQGKIDSAHRNVSKVKIKSYGGPYMVYVSLWNGTSWEGHSKIPYHSRAVDTNADVRFVKKFHIGKNETKTVKMPKVYPGITKIRITFSHLWDSGIGEFQYRAGCADVQVFASTSTSLTTIPKINVGNIKDYTDAIRWILGWGGFFWPDDNLGFSYVTHSDGTKVNYIHADGPEGFMPHGRIWGDLQDTGTYPIVDLTADQFDKQPLSDCLQQIRSIIGFNLFVDETGGVVWRLPNIYTKGNYTSGATGGPNSGYHSDYVTIDEDTTLLGLTTTVSSENVRERVFVGDTTGKFGSTAEGYNPAPSGLRRYGGWTDKNFASQTDAKIMADLIALRQFMTYRTSTITISGNPQIQVDDQVKIYEKITSDTFFHYVTGIQSDWDAKSGKWTYTLNTQWLGTEPGTPEWAIHPAYLDEVTKQYLHNITKGLS